MYTLEMILEVYYTYSLIDCHNLVNLKILWHISSQHLIFLLLIHKNIDCHIFAWNNVNLQKISDNKCNIPSHIPKIEFQAYKWQQGWIILFKVLPFDNACYDVYAMLPALLDHMDDVILIETEA